MRRLRLLRTRNKNKPPQSLKGRENERETQKRKKYGREKKKVRNTEQQQFGKIRYCECCSALFFAKRNKTFNVANCVPENRTGTFNFVLVVVVGDDDLFFFLYAQKFKIFR